MGSHLLAHRGILSVQAYSVGLPNKTTDESQIKKVHEYLNAGFCVCFFFCKPAQLEQHSLFRTGE